jgi:hypothetical protein
MSGSDKRIASEWELVRMGFMLDIVDVALELMEKPAESLLDGINTPAELLAMIEGQEIKMPSDLVEQIKMEPQAFQDFLKAKIPQTDLLLHKAGQDFLARKILEGLTGPEVDPLHAEILCWLLSNEKDKTQFFGRIFYLINQPITGSGSQ